MRRVQLVSHRILRFRRFCSTLPPANVDDVNLKSYLPSEDFLKQYVRRPSHRDKLTTLLSEVQTFLEMFGKDSLPEFDDSLWKTYFGTWSADDRCQLLNELRLERKNDERMADKPEKVQISVINQEREHNGEMVYAPGFHTLLELRGQEFRGDIDNIYGSRLLSLQRCDEELPKLLVDCRFMSEYSSAVQSKFAKQIQSLHDSNWTSRLPFNISIVNFRPDNHLAEIAKRQFLFHYGPPSSVNSSSFRDPYI
ncbi:hypothetical protein Q1695_008500 [Nippostrongylus brasiliensis]|nr:hypothetical protein Q1695_008500 [Nippostrongylus brasiliensis]